MSNKLTKEEAIELLELCIMHMKQINQWFDEIFERASKIDNSML